MSLARLTTLVKNAKLLSQCGNACMKSQARKSHQWYYRTACTPQKWSYYAAEAVMGYGWWWVLWHVWTEPEHIYGEFERVDPRKWTDEELGIPAQDT